MVVFQKVLQQLKQSLFFIALTMAILVVAFGFYFKKNQQDLLAKEMKISHLIDEVGEVKAQNEKLFQYVQQQSAAVATVAEDVDKLHASAPKVPRVKPAAPTETPATSASTSTMANSVMDLLGSQKELLQGSFGEQVGLIPPKQKGFMTVLIVGVHSGLTDTMMLATVNEAKQKVTFVSIPRDLFYNGRKINELYHSYGIEKLEKALEAVSGLFIDKYVVVDMDSFVKVIDMVGGVDIDVPKALTDTLYPGPKKNYIKVSFKKGLQHMDGETALKYARSRESTSDFDRSLRQQQIMTSLKQRLKEIQLPGNLTSFLQVYDAVKGQLKTDITPFDAVLYLKNYFGFELKGGNVLTTQNYLNSTISTGGQYILLPKKKGFGEIQKYIQDLIL